MDKWLTISKSAFELGIHEDDLFDAAKDGKINFHWLPGDDGIDIVKVELIKSLDFDDEKYEVWRRIKGSPVAEHEYGPFLIDVSLNEIWPLLLNDLKDSGRPSAPVDCYSDPLNFKDIEGNVYATYFDDPLDFILPRLSELKISSSDLDRYKNQLKRSNSLPKITDTKKRKDVINGCLKDNKEELDKINYVSGGNGLRDAVWIKVQLTSNKTGYLFAKRGEGSPNKKACFNPVWKDRNKH